MSEIDAERTPLSTAARAGALSGGFVAVLYVIEVLDRVLPGDFESHGVHPRSDDGLQGIAFAPLLHGDWAHLVSNSVPLLILGFLLALSSVRTWMLVADRSGSSGDWAHGSSPAPTRSTSVLRG